jgi:hypothetical protein
MTLLPPPNPYEISSDQIRANQTKTKTKTKTKAKAKAEKKRKEKGKKKTKTLVAPLQSLTILQIRFEKKRDS